MQVAALVCFSASLAHASACRASAGWQPCHAVLHVRSSCARRCAALMSTLSSADVERLLLSEPALNAFICAEMESFCSEAMATLDEEDSLADRMRREEECPGNLAVAQIRDATQVAFQKLHQAGALAGGTSTDALSNLGSAISFLRNEFSTEDLELSLERVGLNTYEVAHHVTDMYHHRCFRGTYTKTLQPSGAGELAARAAIGLPPLEEPEEDLMQDECLVWSPSGSGECIHWKSETDAWSGRRFERVQMEGTRDPRRGGSGTTR
jgi:hypothetical protein